MTLDEQLDRAERALMAMAKADQRERREWRKKVKLLIKAQNAAKQSLMAAGETLQGVRQARLDRKMPESAESKKIVEEPFRDDLKRGKPRDK